LRPKSPSQRSTRRSPNARRLNSTVSEPEPIGEAAQSECVELPRDPPRKRRLARPRQATPKAAASLNTFVLIAPANRDG